MWVVDEYRERWLDVFYMKYTLHELLKKHDREIDAIVWCILNRKYHLEFESAPDKGPWIYFKKGMFQSIPFLPHAICIMYILVMQPSWLR